MLRIVASIESKIIGSISGNASTGKSAPLEDALAINAEIIVEADEIPTLPVSTLSQYIPISEIIIHSFQAHASPRSQDEPWPFPCR